MKTEDLVTTLSKDLRPVPRSIARRDLFAAAAVGVGLALAMLLSGLGVQPLAQAMAGEAFWMKVAYSVTLVGVGWVATRRMGRPDGRLGLAAYAPLAAFGLLAALGLAQLATASGDQRMTLLLGRSWTLCPWLILSLSAPILLALLVAMRRLAPTRPVVAGAAAGLLAGGMGATVYGLHCPETSPAFVAAWYTLGIALSAALGAIAGPRLLRW